MTNIAKSVENVHCMDIYGDKSCTACKGTFLYSVVCNPLAFSKRITLHSLVQLFFTSASERHSAATVATIGFRTHVLSIERPTF